MIYIYIQWMHQKSTSNIATNRFRFKLATNICNLYCFIDKVVIPRHTTYPHTLHYPNVMRRSVKSEPGIIHVLQCCCWQYFNF